MYYYPNHVISAFGDKMFLCGQVCKHKAIKIMLLNAWRLKNTPVEKEKNWKLRIGFANARLFCKLIQT